MIVPTIGDFEVVPIDGTGGKLIHVAQLLNGDGYLNYEHARLYLGEGKCVQAQPGGANIVDLDPNDGGLWSTGLITLTTAQRVAIVKAGWGYKGTPYSVMDYFALIAKRLRFGLIFPWLRNYVKTSKHMICSQLVDKCYQDAGVELFDDKRWNGDVTPADLADLLLKKLLDARR